MQRSEGSDTSDSKRYEYLQVERAVLEAPKKEPNFKLPICYETYGVSPPGIETAAGLADHAN